MFNDNMNVSTQGSFITNSEENLSRNTDTTKCTIQKASVSMKGELKLDFCLGL